MGDDSAPASRATPERTAPLARVYAFIQREALATGFPLRAMVAASAVAHIAVLLLAVNPLHPDEHFQILEFAYARAGLASTGALPWEYAAQIRPSLQPALAMIPLLLLRALGLTSPFLWTFVLKAATLILAAAVTLLVLAHATPTLSRPGKRALWLTSLFLWFQPLVQFRFTSENLGGLLLAAAIPFVVRLVAEEDSRNQSMAAGLLLGLSFVFRFQMAFAIVGLLAWVVLKSRGGWRPAAGLCMSMAVVVAAATLVDRWFYGQWVFTPWNYFRVNLLEGVASTFGTEPWYWYLAGLPLWMAPPLGVVLTLAFLVPLFRRPTNVWVWPAAAFFLGHTIIGHKELRFLLPLIYVAPVLLALAADAVPERLFQRGWVRWTLKALAVQNMAILLLGMTPAPHRAAGFDTHFYHFLWDRAERSSGAPVHVLSDGGNTFSTGIHYVLSLATYRHPSMVEVAYPPGADVATLVPADTPASRLLLLWNRDEPPELAGAVVERLVYRAEPGYMPLVRLMGLEGSPVELRLRRVVNWESYRTVWEVRITQ